MHPYDTRRYVEWAVHLVGRILVAGWLLGLVAGAVALAVAIFGDAENPFGVLWLALWLWPLIVGLWLVFVSAPEPLFLPDDDDDEPSTR